MDNYKKNKLDQEEKVEKDFDTESSRCFGLIERKALKKLNNEIVYAKDIYKSDGPFYCPVCLSEAIVRKCSDKNDHFAHKSRQSPVMTGKHQTLHNQCRDQILEHLKSAFPNGKWEAEREIPKNTEKGFKRIVPDISGRINNIPVAIEVQLSAYTVKKISDKLIEYQKRNPKVAVLYIVPLYEELGVEPFRPRLYEKYLHSLYFGKVYYWTPECETLLLPVHYSPAKRWIEETTWFDIETQVERSEGGFWLTYSTVKMPNFGQAVDITKDFEKVLKNSFEPKNVKKSIPECTIYKDKLKSWWDKNEYKDIDNQFEVFNEGNKPTFMQDYDYFDDYDDEFYNRDE